MKPSRQRRQNRPNKAERSVCPEFGVRRFQGVFLSEALIRTTTTDRLAQTLARLGPAIAFADGARSTDSHGSRKEIPLCGFGRRCSAPVWVWSVFHKQEAIRGEIHFSPGQGGRFHRKSEFGQPVLFTLLRPRHPPLLRSRSTFLTQGHPIQRQKIVKAAVDEPGII